jgi:TM2 domain-containing membrane protein YozV
MTGGGFGRKGSVDGAARAARRAAFLAEERARAGRPGHAPAANPAFVREKSAGTAYLLWFFLGGLSAHRFYLGFPVSGAIQAAFWPLGWALLVSGSLVTFLVMAGGAIWVLADAFLIPGLRREANERLRRNASAAVFA